MTKYTIAEEVLRRSDLGELKKAEIIIQLIERIQAIILFEINGFSEAQSEQYGKEYQGSTSDKIIDAIISSFSKFIKLSEGKKDSNDVKTNK
jgi:hypothetical protein